METNKPLAYSFAGKSVVTIRTAPLEIADGCAEVACIGDYFLSVAMKVPGMVSPQAFIINVSREDAEFFDSNETAVRRFLGYLFTLFSQTRAPGHQAARELGEILTKLERALASVGIRVSAFAPFQQLMKGML